MLYQKFLNVLWRNIMFDILNVKIYRCLENQEKWKGVE